MSKIRIHPGKPILIAGPTASGKSALALEIATRQGGAIVNADALQVFDGWRIITARPNDKDLDRAKHVFYGHVPFDQPYSVGNWLRDLEPHLQGSRPIIVGGTGLYFSALTEGLAEIPATDPSVRKTADQLSIQKMISELDAKTMERIDTKNRARVQRAWEVLTQTGRGLADWQNDTPPPRLPLSETIPILLEAPKEWLTPRIERRFHAMIDEGALDEARSMLSTWHPDHPSSKAIGASELIAHLSGELSLDAAIEAAIIASRQYAKRQRTWFSKRMRDWQSVSMPNLDLTADLLFDD